MLISTVFRISSALSVQVSRVQPTIFVRLLWLHSVQVLGDALLDFLPQGFLPLGGEGRELLNEVIFPVVGK